MSIRHSGRRKARKGSFIPCTKTRYRSEVKAQEAADEINNRRVKTRLASQRKMVQYCHTCVGWHLF